MLYECAGFQASVLLWLVLVACFLHLGQAIPIFDQI
jgi:hypothetical protein